MPSEFSCSCSQDRLRDEDSAHSFVPEFWFGRYQAPSSQLPKVRMQT